MVVDTGRLRQIRRLYPTRRGANKLHMDLFGAEAEQLNKATNNSIGYNCRYFWSSINLLECGIADIRRFQVLPFTK